MERGDDGVGARASWLQRHADNLLAPVGIDANDAIRCQEHAFDRRFTVSTNHPVDIKHENAGGCRGGGRRQHRRQYDRRKRKPARSAPAHHNSAEKPPAAMN